MITVFNRAVVYTGFSMKEVSRVRDILSANKIDYRVKVINFHSSTRERIGTFGQNMDFAYEYDIYVHKKDAEQARYLINNNSGLQIG